MIQRTGARRRLPAANLSPAATITTTRPATRFTTRRKRMKKMLMNHQTVRMRLNGSLSILRAVVFDLQREAVDALEQPALELIWRKILRQGGDDKFSCNVEHQRPHQESLFARARHHHLAHHRFNFRRGVIHVSTPAINHRALIPASTFPCNQHHNPSPANSSHLQAALRSVKFVPSQAWK